MISPDRAGALLLCYLAGAFVAGVPASDAGWLALALVPWALALAAVPELPWSPAFAAWAAWLGWSGACALVSPEPWLSLVAWWRGASLLIAAALAAAWWTRRERRLWALALVSLGALGAAGLAAARLGFDWPSALLLPRGLWAAAGAAAAAGWLSADDEAGSPAAWVALLAGAAATALEGPWSARLALAAAGSYCLAGGRRGAPGVLLLLAILASLVIDPEGWGSWRPAGAWSAAADVMRAHPVTGVGPGLLAREISRLGLSGLGSPSFVLGVGAETGYFGLLLFFAAAAASVPAGFRRLDAPGRACAASLAALAVYALLDDVPASPAFLAGLAGACAVGLSPGRLGEARASDLGTPLRLQRWFTALGLAAALACALPRELLRRSLEEAAAAASPRARIAALERASRLAPQDGAIHARLAQENLLARPARVGEALRRIRLAAEAEPVNAVYRARLAELWAAFGALDRAAGAARAALRLEPRLASPRLILAQWSAEEGRLDEALAWLEEARARREPAGDSPLSEWDQERERRILERAGRR